MLTISYRPADFRAELKWDPADDHKPWLSSIRRIVLDSPGDIEREGGRALSLLWSNFVGLRREILQVIKANDLKKGVHVSFSSSAEEQLFKAKQNATSYEHVDHCAPLDGKSVAEKLKQAGFTRNLTGKQLRNVCRIAPMSAAATFSVPGAGKTTEALACFFIRAEEGDNLLVIAPKNAFAAWDEQLADCVPDCPGQFVRLRGGKDKIGQALTSKPQFAIITYEQMAIVSDLVASYCADRRVHVFLDESHRIKSGKTKPIAGSVLKLSHLPKSKLILSGTPMPQDEEDLIPQFGFLYPELPVRAHNVVEKMRSVFVRTTKKELDLPPLTRTYTCLPMNPMQSELYRLMKSELARDAAETVGLGWRAKSRFRRLGRSVARLLQFVSNPALLSREVGFAHEGLLSVVLSEGDGPKIRRILKRTRALASEGNKVLVWTSFVRNVEYLAQRLSDLGAVYIHGGVDSGHEDDDETREGKIKQFCQDTNTRIMVANPAAAGESISLHQVCHHALYLDRTFNAAHYLQSEDRIHRFGLPSGQLTSIEIIECRETIDETVRERLNLKIEKMAEALRDEGLSPAPIRVDPADLDVQDDNSSGMDREDFMTLLKHLEVEQ